MLPIENKNFKEPEVSCLDFCQSGFSGTWYQLYLFHQLEDDAQEIIIAGRQRMLSQSISKMCTNGLGCAGQDKALPFR